MIERRRVGEAAVDGCVPERQHTRLIEARIDDRVDGRQVGAADGIAPLDEHGREMAFRGRVAVLSGVDGGADQIVGKGDHATRRPECVVCAKLDVGLHRRLWFPRQGIEAVAFEPPD